MANTLIPIETITVGPGGQAAIEFTNISQNYTDLYIVASLRTTTNDGYQSVTVNFNGSPSYSLRRLYNVGSDSASANYWAIAPADSASLMTANTYGSMSIYIPNYTGTTNKSASIDVVVENNVSGGVSWQGLNAGLATLTSAITAITLAPYGGNNFKQHSSATLYGVRSAGYGAYATGGIISQDETYWYHTFTASGTFTPTQNLTADCLVVGGGGGGGGVRGSSIGAGGGGAGGYRTGTGLSVTASTGYTVTVGAGGTNGTGSTRGTNGTNSVFSTITSSGGGVGASRYSDGAENANGGNGGSGGGGRGGTTANGVAPGTGGTGNSGSYSPVEGYAGGDGQNDGSRSGGGGGGASESGNINSGSDGGDGSVFNGVTYAGGGGGGKGSQAATYGIGGSGGGGNGGGSDANGSAGSINTGGGGGGGGHDTNETQTLGGSGGSGIVIIRYAK